jgi:hypothetical protein
MRELTDCSCSAAKRTPLTSLLISVGICEKRTMKPPMEEDADKKIS